MPQFPSLHKGRDVLGQPFIQGGWGGVCSPWPPPPQPHSLTWQQQDEEEVNISQESSEEEQ